jgi:hypothetical protein
MKMSPQQREQLRLSLLRFMDENPSRFGLPTDFLLQQARSEGRQALIYQEVETELEYLAEKGLCSEVPKTISPEKRNWKISANGRDFLAQQSA